MCENPRDDWGALNGPQNPRVFLFFKMCWFSGNSNAICLVYYLNMVAQMVFIYKIVFVFFSLLEFYMFILEIWILEKYKQKI